jgi:hypothetical protein
MASSIATLTGNAWEHACTLVDETALTNAARLTIITLDPPELNYDEANPLE